MGYLAAIVLLLAAAARPRETEVLSAAPDPSVITDPDVRAAIADSGKPWRIRDKDTGIVFVLVPQGASYIGANEDDKLALAEEKPRFHVTCTSAYYMAEGEVTFGQWRTTAGNQEHGVAPIGGYRLDEDQHPVIMVSWLEANRWCQERGWRLPDEREWEYAARGRVNALRPTVWPWGDSDAGGAGYGNMPDLTARKVEPAWDVLRFEDGFVAVAPVKSFKPNGFGLYDMIGNASEWCANAFDPASHKAWAKVRGLRDPAKPVTPRVPEAASVVPESIKRVVRGGAWYPPAKACRFSYRFGHVAGMQGAQIGFRPVRDS